MFSALCLAMAIHFEARGESITGQAAVAEVILNRVADPRYPDNVCAVVLAPSQFSFTSGSMVISDHAAWAESVDVAWDALMFCDNCNGLTSTHYYAGATPGWASAYALEGQIGGHTFMTNGTPYP